MNRVGLHNHSLTESGSISVYLSDINCNGVMGVPITFLDKYNPDQFEILRLDRYTVPASILVGGRLEIQGSQNMRGY